jgi:hypothetical protein
MLEDKMNKDIIKYCIRHMSSKELIHQLFDNNVVFYRKSDSYEKLVDRLNEKDYEKINKAIITKYYRDNWKSTNTKLHIENLKSGLLFGHNWHGAMPSMLHLSLQNKVRDHIDGKLTLEELISIGSDIMKHEYFMVAAHDLCETMIIETFPNTIPPIGSKSISDFIFEGIPYDLKITNYFGGQTKEYVNKNKQAVAEQLLAGADVQRIREQAKKTVNNWGLNRFYFLVEDQVRWIKDPEGVLTELIEEVSKLKAPFVIKIDGIEIKVQLIAI